MRNAGRIYESEEGTWYTAMHADQTNELLKQRKIVVFVHVPANTLFPEMNEEKGSVQKVIKSLDKLKLVGFIN